MNCKFREWLTQTKVVYKSGQHVACFFFTLKAVVNNVINKLLNGFFGDMNVATLQRKYIAHVEKLCLTLSFMETVMFVLGCGRLRPIDKLVKTGYCRF